MTEEEQLAKSLAWIGRFILTMQPVFDRLGASYTLPRYSTYFEAT